MENNCENCNYKTKKPFGMNAKDFPERTRKEKSGKIYVCKKCHKYFEQSNRFLNKIIESGKKYKRIVVLAGPGTGKTYTFKKFIERNFKKSESIYIITFINNLVDDLKNDIKEELSEWENITVSTFHKFSYYLLKSLGKNHDYCADLTDLVLEDLKIIENQEIEKKKIKKDFNNFRATENIKKYFERSNYYNAVGNDNVCFGVLKLLGDDPDNSLKRFLSRYSQIVIDEYQDFNFTESEIINLISEKCRLLIAGDDDQSLYTFKHSHPKYIRKLWNGKKFKNHELPFCRRCPEVIIESLKAFVENAQARNLLKERIPKKYFCYFPDKYQDSKKYNKIFWYKTSVRRGDSKNVEDIIIKNIEDYYKKGETERGGLNFLVIIPDTRGSQKNKIKENVIKRVSVPTIDCEKEREKTLLPITEGYRYLKKDKKSNLGWRIVIKNDSFKGWEKIIQKSSKNNFFNLLSDNFMEKHLRIVSTTEESKICEEEKNEKEGVKILFTNYYGAKGLSADHVFILFPQDGVFPKNPQKPTNDETYKFLVALTRTKKSLTIITCYHQNYKHNSVFLRMLPQQNINSNPTK